MSNATRNRQAGFNLLELMITIMIAAIVLGIGVPSFTAFIDNNRMAAASNDLVTAIHTARTEAVKRRAPATLCASGNWDAAAPACDFGADGWIVFADLDGDATVDAGETVVFRRAPFEDIQLTFDAGSTAYVQFGGNGFPRTAAVGVPIANFQLCDRRGDVSVGSDADGNQIAAGRWIAVGATGRPQLHRLRADVQGNPLGGC